MVETQISEKKKYVHFHSAFNVKFYVNVRKTYVNNQISSAVIKTQRFYLHCRQLGVRLV